MQIKVNHDSGFNLISLEGDFLTEGEQNKLRDQVRMLLDQGKVNLIIDLTSVKHINSCGLGALVCAFTSLRRSGGDLRLVGVNSTVADLLKITQLSLVFKISPTIDKAISEFRNG